MASLLANLLVSATGRDDELNVDNSVESGDPSREGARDQVHSQRREETSRNASRKARVLSKHHQVLVQWAAIPTMNSSAPKNVSCSRLKQDNPTVSYKEGAAASAKDAADINRTSPSPTVFVRSDLLSLKFTEDLGRHLVAMAAPIPAGTLLLRERPYAWCLRRELAGELCAHCLHEVTASASPCSRCGLVAFCSAKCEENAWKAWHGSECLDVAGKPQEPTLSSLSSECRLVLRAVRRNLREEISEQSTISPTGVARKSGTLPSGTPSSSECGGKLAMGFSALQEHYTGRSPRQQELLETEVAIAAVLATGGGRRSGSSNRSENGPGDGSVEESSGPLAAKLATALVKVTTNAFTVSTLRSTEPAVGHVQAVNHTRVAVGLYCTAAMLNHSCVPNALATFDGSEIRIITTRVINIGEPVTISYGPLVSKVYRQQIRKQLIVSCPSITEILACPYTGRQISSTSQRRSLLRSAYFFHCGCVGCHPNSVAIDRFQAHPGSSNLRHVAEAQSKVTEFGCLKAGCSGTLLAVMPQAQSQPQCCDERGETLPSVQVPRRLSSSSLKVFLRCERCGARLSQRSANMLLKEDEDDRRLWIHALSAVARCEDEARREGGLGRKGAVASSGEASGDTAAAAKELVQRARWRDHRLSLTSMRRAIAHDAHARLLAMEGDFSSAADACTRALQVLTRRFSPEERELGVEYLKLAELCFSAGLVERCMAACQHARVSLDVCLASNDEQLIALSNMQAACAAQLL